MDPGRGEIEELIARVALGDRTAFRTLYRRTGPKLYGICLRILRDRSDADEALQDIYVKIWQKAGRFSPERAGPMSWLSTIARNHAIDVVRARRPAATELERVYDLSDPGQDPETRAVLAAEWRRIEKCMEELDPDRAEAVRKAYVEGLSYQELADRYGVPLNTMRTWLRRSLIKLKKCLER